MFFVEHKYQPSLMTLLCSLLNIYVEYKGFHWPFVDGITLPNYELFIYIIVDRNHYVLIL